MADVPRGFHQSAASRPKKAASSGLMLAAAGSDEGADGMFFALTEERLLANAPGHSYQARRNNGASKGYGHPWPAS
jgi:hypothetical protein